MRANGDRHVASGSASFNLDFLRAIAVLSVYVAHVLYTVGLASGNSYGPPDFGWFLGRFGVLIFFVHTSLVLMMSLERMERANRPLFRAFYIRRFFRIYPLSMACVTIIVLFHLPYSSRLAWVHPSRSTALANLLLGTDLFHKGTVTAVLWTLPLEVQMYLLLPFVYMIGKKYRMRGIVILWLGAIAASYIQPYVSSRLVIAAYVPCFLAGVSSYFVGFGTFRRRLPFIGWPLAIAAAAVIFFAFGSRHRYEPWWIMCLVIGLSAPLFAEVKFLPLCKVSSWVARYSYGIYLTHMYALWAALVVLKNEPLWIRCGVLATLSVGLPVLFYEFLEAPMMKLGTRLTNRLPASESATHGLDRSLAGSTRLSRLPQIKGPDAEVSDSSASFSEEVAD